MTKMCVGITGNEGRLEAKTSLKAVFLAGTVISTLCIGVGLQTSEARADCSPRATKNADTINCSGNIGDGSNFINSLAGDDSLTVHDFNSTGSTVTISGGMGNDTVTLTGSSITGAISGGSGAGADSISVLNSTLNGDVQGGDGADAVVVDFSTVTGFVQGGGGNDSITIQNGSNVSGLIFGGNGEDILTVMGNSTVNSITGGSDAGNDTIQLIDSFATGRVFGGDGDDNISLSASSVQGSVLGGGGNDAITINSSAVKVVRGQAGDDVIALTRTRAFFIDAGDGNDVIKIEQGSTLNKIDAGTGNDAVIINDSRLLGRGDGNIVKMGDGDDVFQASNLNLGLDQHTGTPMVIDGGTGFNTATVNTLTSNDSVQFNHWAGVSLGGAITAPELNMVDSVLRQTDGDLVISAPASDAPAQRFAGAAAPAANGALLSLDGTSRIYMVDQAANDSITVSRYQGAAGSQLAVDVNAANGSADHLIVNSASGNTGIAVNLINPIGTIIATPIPVVVLANPTADASSFFLLNGPINNGLTQIALLFDPTSGNFVLASTPGDTGLSNPASATGIINHISAELDDRATQRSEDILSSQEKGRGGRLPGATQVTPGSWSQIVGSAVEQDTKVSTNIAGSPFTQLDSYNLGLFGLIGGLDIAKAGITSDGTRYAMLAGVLAGYLTADVDFDVSASSQSVEAGVAGLYTGLSYGGWRAHLLGKVDFGSLKFKEPDFGAKDSSDFQTYSVEFNGAYNFDLGDSMYIQPIGSVYYAHTDIGDATLAGTTIKFKSQDSVRLRAGVRFGQDKHGETHVFKPWVQASIWQEVGDVNSKLALTSGGAPLDLISAGVETYGELGIGLNAVHIGPGLSGQVRGDLKFGDLNFLGAAAQLGLEYRWPVK
jgi:Autotransporter beta-domain